METTRGQIEQECDDHAVDQFAAAMKEKLEAARHKGRGGWHDPDQCSASFLADLLIGHLSKGNEGTFLDVANFCMMLHQRGESPEVLQYADRLAALERENEQLRDGIRALADDWETSEDLALSTYAGQAVEKCADQLLALLGENNG